MMAGTYRDISHLLAFSLYIPRKHVREINKPSVFEVLKTV